MWCPQEAAGEVTERAWPGPRERREATPASPASPASHSARNPPARPRSQHRLIYFRLQQGERQDSAGSPRGGAGVSSPSPFPPPPPPLTLPLLLGAWHSSHVRPAPPPPPPAPAAAEKKMSAAPLSEQMGSVNITLKGQHWKESTGGVRERGRRGASLFTRASPLPFHLKAATEGWTP